MRYVPLLIILLLLPYCGRQIGELHIGAFGAQLGMEFEDRDTEIKADMFLPIHGNGLATYANMARSMTIYVNNDNIRGFSKLKADRPYVILDTVNSVLYLPFGYED